MDTASGTAAITIGIGRLQNVEGYEARANSLMLIILHRILVISTAIGLYNTKIIVIRMARTLKLF